MNESKEPTWPVAIREACRLWLSIEAAEEDDRRGSTIYAVDSNLGFLYSQPVEASLRAQLLGLLLPDVLPDLAHLLGRIAIEIGESSEGLTLLPGHDREFLEVFRAIRQKFDEDHNGRIRLRLLNADLAEELGKNSAARAQSRDLKRLGQADVSRLAKAATSELTILPQFLRTPAFNILRWYDFISRSRLHAARDSRYSLPALTALPNKLAGQMERWHEAIRREAPKRAWQQAVDDAEAVATLGGFNEALANAGDHRRIVLLTTDEALQTAAWRNPAFPGANAVRDPRALTRKLPNDLIHFLPTQEEAASHLLDGASYTVAGMLRILLAPFADGGQIDRDKIRGLAIRPGDDPIWPRVSALFAHHHRLVGKQVERLDIVQSEWNRFIRLGVNRYAAEHIAGDPRLATLAQLIATSPPDGLEQELRAYIVNTTSSLSVSTLVAGLYITLQLNGGGLAHTKRLSRMPVALRSGDPDEMLHYHNFMENAVEHNNMNNVLPFQNPDGQYRAHLYYGVYFAAAGDWEAAETVARAAVGFADARARFQTDGLRPEDTGEEAAYLLAVAVRHRASSPTELDYATRCLDEFRARVLRRGNIKDVRWELEAVAIDLMRLYGSLILDEKEGWKRTEDAGRTNKGELLHRLESMRAALNDEECSQNLADPAMLAILRKQIFGNIVSLGMYEYLQEGESTNQSVLQSESFAAAVRQLDGILANLSAGNSLQKSSVSRYIQILLAFGRLMAHPKDGQSRRELLHLVAAAREQPEMPYDVKRFTMLEDKIRNM